MKWIVSVPYLPPFNLYKNLVCDSLEEAQELVRTFKKAKISEVRYRLLETDRKSKLLTNYERR